MPTQEQQTINQVELALYNAFHRQYILFSEEPVAEKTTVLESLVNEARSVNYHLQLFSVDEIAKQWIRIRGDSDLVIALLSISTDFINELEINGLGFDVVVNSLATSIAIINRPDSVIDKVLTERSPTLGQLTKTLADNPWVVALYYIGRSVHIYNLYLALNTPKKRGRAT